MGTDESSMPAADAGMLRGASTRQAILAATKELVALRGPDGTTVRNIASLSGANHAAIAYYFQSKDKLVRLATGEITADVNRERIARLEALEHAAGGRALEPVAILEALIAPILDASRSADGGSLYIRTVFQARVNAEFGQGTFDMNADVARRFVDAISRTFAGETREQAIWRYEFARGAAVHLVANLDPLSRRFEHIARLDGEPLAATPAHTLDRRHIEQVIALIAGGFCVAAAAEAPGIRSTAASVRGAGR